MGRKRKGAAVRQLTMRDKDGRLLQLDILKEKDIEAQIIRMRGRPKS